MSIQTIKENDVACPDPDNSINSDNPKPGRNHSAGVDGEVGGEGRSPAGGSGGDGGDDSQRTRHPDDGKRPGQDK